MLTPGSPRSWKLRATTLTLPVPFFAPLDPHLVLAAVEEQVEPPALIAGLAGPAERSRHAVDQLDGAALRVLDAHRVAAEAVDREESLLDPGRRQLGGAQRDRGDFGRRSHRSPKPRQGRNGRGEPARPRPGRCGTSRQPARSRPLPRPLWPLRRTRGTSNVHGIPSGLLVVYPRRIPLRGGGNGRRPPS